MKAKPRDLSSRKRFYEPIRPEQTPRKCETHQKVLAIGFVYIADAAGKKNKSTRTPVCRECLTKERGNL